MTFDGDIDGGTVTDDSLLVIGEVSGYLPGLVTWDATANTATFVPDGRA